MKNLKLLASILLVLSINIANAQTYNAETGKSTLKWIGKKVTGEHSGTINLKSGEFTLNNNKIKSGNFVIDMTSMVCIDLENEEYNQKLIGHLTSDDFFGTNAYPTASLLLTKSSEIQNNSYTVYGELTIKGITHPIEFKVNLKNTDDGLKVSGDIIVDRTKYNIKYGSGRFYDKLGDNMIYDEFIIKLNVLASAI